MPSCKESIYLKEHHAFNHYVDSCSELFHQLDGLLDSAHLETSHHPDTTGDGNDCAQRDGDRQSDSHDHCDEDSHASAVIYADSRSDTYTPSQTHGDSSHAHGDDCAYHRFIPAARGSSLRRWRLH
jgi:hypothetical protein